MLPSGQPRPDEVWDRGLPSLSGGADQAEAHRTDGKCRMRGGARQDKSGRGPWRVCPEERHHPPAGIPSGVSDALFGDKRGWERISEKNGKDSGYLSAWISAERPSKEPPGALRAAFLAFTSARTSTACGFRHALWSATELPSP